jgi:hypothetical protein
VVLLAIVLLVEYFEFVFVDFLHVAIVTDVNNLNLTADNRQMVYVEAALSRAVIRIEPEGHDLLHDVHFRVAAAGAYYFINLHHYTFESAF